MKDHYRRVSNIFKAAAAGTIILFLLWVWVAATIFRFRHPWATDTEIFMHLGDAVMLRKISYQEMRQ